MISRIRTALDRLIARHTQDFPCEGRTSMCGAARRTKPSTGRYEKTREFTENDALWPCPAVACTWITPPCNAYGAKRRARSAPHSRQRQRVPRPAGTTLSGVSSWPLPQRLGANTLSDGRF